MVLQMLFLIKLFSPLLGIAQAPAVDTGLQFTVEVLTTTTLEVLPIVVTLTLKNVSGNPVITYYRRDEPELLGLWSILHTRSESGREITVMHMGGPSASIPVPPGCHLDPGEAISLEYLIAPVVRRETIAKPVEKPDDEFEFIPPGSYTATVELPLPFGKTIKSAPIQFVINEAIGPDRDARGLLAMRHIDFLTGHEVPQDPSMYGARIRRGSLDVSRYAELEDLRKRFPTSTYATWVRFWKLYHHGPIDDALQFARDNPGFPLSDNLMLRMAEGLFNKGEHARSREITAELLNRFPDGDTRERARELQDRLAKKP